MKLLTLFLLITLSTATEELKIYFFETGQAESQLIVFPSGYSILIDLGENSKTKTTNAKYVAKRVEQILGKKHIDVFVLTHYHWDHYGVVEKNGVWYFVEKLGFTFGKFLKRNAGQYNGEKLSDCKKSKISWNIVGTMSSETAKFVCYATSTKEKTKLSAIAETAHRCNTEQIHPPDEGASVMVLQRDALGVKDKKGNKISKNTMNKNPPVSENDLSICMRIQYGEFVYATCGDMTGKDATYSSKSYHDVESLVAPMMGSVDVMKVNHHGASSGTNTKWCKTLNPTVAVITCGAGTDLPNTTPLKNLKNIGAKVYIPRKECNQNNIKKYSNIKQMGDDVVITVPKNGTTFTVANSKGEKSKTFNIKLNKKAPEPCKKLEQA